MGDPKDGTLGKVWRGDYGGAVGDVGGGLGNVVKGGAKVTEAVLNPIGAIQGYGKGMGGTEIGLDEVQPPSAEQLAQQQSEEAARAQKNKDEQNKKLLSDQMATQTAQGEEDAFIQARNAARKAKGTQLFQAWG